MSSSVLKIWLTGPKKLTQKALMRKEQVMTTVKRKMTNRLTLKPVVADRAGE